MNSENNVYYKAEISLKKSKLLSTPILSKIAILSVAIAILSVVFFILAYSSDFGYEDYDWWRTDSYYRNSYYRTRNFYTLFFIVILSVTGISFIWSAIQLIVNFTIKKCSLELNRDGVFGCKKKLFSSESINQPFEQIDSIYQKNGLIDKIIGGQTIVISSASSKIIFFCIANAQEFVDKTLEELKKYKESVASNKEKAPASSESDAMDALLKLKSLLDQGLISQEEFEEKRRSLVEKI